MLHAAHTDTTRSRPHTTSSDLDPRDAPKAHSRPASAETRRASGPCVPPPRPGVIAASAAATVVVAAAAVAAAGSAQGWTSRRPGSGRACPHARWMQQGPVCKRRARVGIRRSTSSVVVASEMRVGKRLRERASRAQTPDRRVIRRLETAAFSKGLTYMRVSRLSQIVYEIILCHLGDTDSHAFAPDMFWYQSAATCDLPSADRPFPPEPKTWQYHTQLHTLPYPLTTTIPTPLDQPCQPLSHSSFAGVSSLPAGYRPSSPRISSQTLKSEAFFPVLSKWQSLYKMDRRDTLDVAHKIVAVGSRSVDSAQAFIEKHAGKDSGIKAYGSYSEVFADPVSWRTW